MFRRSTAPEVSPADVVSLPEGHVLLDVREDDEWAAGHAPDAHHLALSDLDPRALPPGVAGRVLCVCRSGGRSAKAVAVLRDSGVDAVNVRGGMSAWVSAGLPVVRDDGRPGIVI